MPTTSNYWDSTYGRGIGGPNSPSSSSSSYGTQAGSTYQTPSYTQPSVGTQTAQNSTSNMGASDWWDAARFAYGVYKDRNPTKPKFEDVPLSPEQKQMYQIYIQSMLNPATVNNASALNQMATQMLGGMSHMQWQSPRTFNGQPGYTGSNLSFTPPQGGPGGTFGSSGSGQPQTQAPPMWSGNSDPKMGGGFTPPNNGSTVGGYVNGGPFNPDYAPGGVGTGPNNAEPGDMSALFSIFTKTAGPWNQKEETYEKWLSRAASVVGGMFGFPIPANLIDKGIDAVQWLYRSITGGGTPTTPLPNPTRGLGDVAKDAPGTSGASGGTYPAPSAPYSGYQIDPSTGQVTRPNDPFNYGGYAGGANAGYNADFWRGLQTGPGGGASPAEGGPTVQSTYGRGAGRSGRV